MNSSHKNEWGSLALVWSVSIAVIVFLAATGRWLLLGVLVVASVGLSLQAWWAGKPFWPGGPSRANRASSDQGDRTPPL
jgi:hypothetical protein